MCILYFLVLASRRTYFRRDLDLVLDVTLTSFRRDLDLLFDVNYNSTITKSTNVIIFRSSKLTINNQRTHILTVFVHFIVDLLKIY